MGIAFPKATCFKIIAEGVQCANVGECQGGKMVVCVWRNTLIEAGGGGWIGCFWRGDLEKGKHLKFKLRNIQGEEEEDEDEDEDYDDDYDDEDYDDEMTPHERRKTKRASTFNTLFG